MRRKFLIIFMSFLIAPNIRADEKFSAEVIDYLTALKVTYKAQYAPAEWKKKHFNYNLEDNYNDAVKKVQAHPDLNLKESHKILLDFIGSMKDYHTRIHFYSTESATLPLTIQGTSDKFYIVHIDRDKLPEDVFPYHVGDEVVSFAEKPTIEILNSLLAQTIPTNPATDKALAELQLTERYGGVFPVPNGVVTLGIRPKGSSKVFNYQTLWDYTPEKFPEKLPEKYSNSTFISMEKQSEILHPTMRAFFSEKKSKNLNVIGDRKSFTPALGTKIWESSDDDFYDAYIYRNNENKLIGYIRIAHYMGTEETLTHFSKIIELFQNTTDAMVIDQVNNPGGSVFYLYALASMLTDEPLVTPRHRMSVTQADMDEAFYIISALKDVKNDAEAKEALKMAGNTFQGYPINYEFAKFFLNYANFIVSQINNGHTVTDPYWLIGVDHINPAAIHYSKPILLLINHLDFSGGDFFPAILQDNKRVTILGSQTAGAGGYVGGAYIPNNLGVIFNTTTRSIAERVEGEPIENLGVKPDIEYEMTEEDYTSNYSPYIKKIQETINNICK